jgi:hypothetical protein
MTAGGRCSVCGYRMDPWLSDHGYERHVLCEGKTTPLDRSRRARDEALAAVEGGADAAWMAAAKRVLWALIKSGQEFTADDVWEQVPTPREPRALGPVMRAAQRAGYMEDTGRMAPSRRRHATKITVWRGHV